jgi:acetyl esterase/lipase
MRSDRNAAKWSAGIGVAIAAACLLAEGRPAAQGRKTEAPPAAALTKYQNLPLWPAGQVPMATGTAPLDAPFLTTFLPRPGTANGGAVIIAPGGSNIMLMYGAEGFEVAEHYNDWGVTAFVLTYRLSPRYDDAARVLDGQRAIRFVRAHAAEWHLDPARIGYIGFSAGSNMGRPIAATATTGDPQAADPVERASARPDYLALVYGAGRAMPGESLKDFPPTFLLSAAGDRQPSLANAQLFAELTRAGAVAEIHVYQKGRHGFGAGDGSPEFSGWMPILKHFLETDGFLSRSNP